MAQGGENKRLTGRVRSRSCFATTAISSAGGVRKKITLRKRFMNVQKKLEKKAFFREKKGKEDESD